jgi:hypothetical protein
LILRPGSDFCVNILKHCSEGSRLTVGSPSW